MNPEPKLSILLVSYNQERFIEQCLQGILIQDYAHAFEVVVADDHECVMSFNRAILYREERQRFEVRGYAPNGTVEYITTARLAAGEGIGNLSTCVFRASAVRRLDDEFWSMGAADWGFGLALGQFGLIARLPGPMSVYRIHAGGLWSGRNKTPPSAAQTDSLARWDRYLGYRFSREFKAHRRKLRWRRLRRDWRGALRNAIARLFGRSDHDKT